MHRVCPDDAPLGRRRGSATSAWASGVVASALVNDESRSAPEGSAVGAGEDPIDALPRSGFFRVEGPERRLPRAPEGPPWTGAEADAALFAFLRALAGERPTVDHRDPLEFARANDLLLLFDAEAQAAFETHLARLPTDRAAAWRDLLAGGTSSEAFGPLTLQEKLDERELTEALRLGRRQRIVNVTLALVALVGLVGGLFVGWRALTGGESRTRGALRFAPVGEGDVGAVAGGAPVAVAELTAPLSTSVAVAAGEGPLEDRLVDAPFADHRLPPGSVWASLFAYDGVGQVALVGPDGWAVDACVRASVVTGDLRPLDTVTTGPCRAPVGRPAVVTCRGDDALVLAVDVPEGGVELPEGGTGFADAVRVQVIESAGGDYDSLSIRGTIAVDPSADVAIPAFGGAPGDELEFTLGADRSGSCVLTGTTGTASEPGA